MNTKHADGLGTQLRRLLELLDGDLETIYRERHPVYTPRFTPVVKALTAESSLTIKEIAARSNVSHSAASQTVSKLKSHGLVDALPARDQRSKRISLTESGQAMLPMLSVLWDSTTTAAEELEAELSYSLSAILTETIERLEHRSFQDRIESQLKIGARVPDTEGVA